MNSLPPHLILRTDESAWRPAWAGGTGTAVHQLSGLREPQFPHLPHGTSSTNPGSVTWPPWAHTMPISP